jgi:hypothetical protein
LGKLLESHKAGVFLNPELIKLIKLVTDATSLRGLLLRPIPALPELPQAISESGRYVVHLRQSETLGPI